MRNRKCRKFSLMILALVAAASLVGCRVSPALIDTIYTADADEVDPNPTARSFTDDGTEDNDASQEREENNAEEQNQESEQTEGIQDDTSEDDNKSTVELAEQYKSNEDLNSSNHAGEGDSSGNTESSEEDTDGNLADISDESNNQENNNSNGTSLDDSGNVSGNSDNTAADNDSDNTAADNDSDNTAADNDNETGNGGGSTDTSDSSVKDVPRKVVTDASGIEQEIPEDVYTVTAVGAAAPIVAMVGGVGRLIATSESFSTNEIGSIIISNSSDDEINIWWSGDGSGGISDENFEALLQVSPDVCFEISGEATFSSEQITELQEHGIGYLVLPELSSCANIKDAVMIVAEALETNEDTGESASVIANRYCDWVDECLTDAADNRETLDYYSIYISEWRSDVTYERRFESGYFGEGRDCIVDFPESSGVTNGTGQGVAVASTDVDGQPFFELWESAGILEVYTNSYQYLRADWYGYTSTYVFPYMSWFGIPTFSDKSIYWTFDYELFSSDSSAGYYVVNTVPNSFGIEFPKLTQGEYRNKETHLGGSERYSVIVVADEETKEAISSSPQWKAGFLDSTSVEEYAIDIAGDYEIYVNPTGFGNWAEGSVDSPLEAYWILCKISGGISESRLINEVKSFYSEFYGITLSDSQIENIINQ